MLARIRKAMDENEEGFTLIELLVVMIIIGILAAIAIPVFLNQRENGYRSAIQTDLRNAATAIESYAVGNNGSYTGLATAGTALADITTAGFEFNGSEDVTVTLESVSATDYTLTATHRNLGETGALETWYFQKTVGQPSDTRVTATE